MDVPTTINWSSPFPILGVLGGIFLIFHFFTENIHVSKQNSEGPDQTSHYAVSALNLHCLPMSHK